MEKKRKKEKTKKPQYESAIGIHTPSPFELPPPPSLPHPSRLIQSPCLSFLSQTANSRWLSILHMVMSVSTYAMGLKTMSYLTIILEET